MIRKILLFLLLPLFLLSAIGFVTSLFIFIMTIINKDIPFLAFGVILGIPLFFISFLIAIIKTHVNKGDERYGLRFWPAVKDAPKCFSIAIHPLVLLVAICIFLFNKEIASDISSVMMLFYYISTIIYLSTFIKIIKTR